MDYEDYDKFDLYKELARFSTSSRNKEVREKDAIKKVRSISGKSIKDTLNDIENTNPYEKGYTRRTDFDGMERRVLNLKNEERVKNKFGAIDKNGDKVNHSEHMIERHIMLSDKYTDVIGKPVHYEFVPHQDSSLPEHPIDLITYVEETNTINLIELKKCSYIRGGSRTADASSSDELFIRAAFEISTYYTFFKHLLDDEDSRKKVKESFDRIAGINIDIDNVNINKVILAPFELFINYSDEVDNLMNNYECYTIELNDGYDDLRQYCVNSDEKLFKIEKK